MFEVIIVSFDQKTYVNNYNKNTYKMYPFRVRKDDVDIINKLAEIPNINGYIHSLIKHDISPSVLTLKQIKERMIPILNKHSIYEIYLFGSYARGEAKEASDIDIYCESGDIKTFLDQEFLEDELEEALGKKVDLIFIGTQLNDYFLEQLERDKIKLC